MLRWKLILEVYGQDIEYIKYGENIVADKLSRSISKENQETTQYSIYKNIFSEINDTEELPDGISL